MLCRGPRLLRPLPRQPGGGTVSGATDMTITLEINVPEIVTPAIAERLQEDVFRK